MDIDTSQEFPIGDGLTIKWVRVADLKEQDVNAQVMEPKKFDRLTQNIKHRGQLESLPYCYQKDGKGTIQIISGHHRTRGALAAGIETIPVIVDTQSMTRSTIIAKQIAANELTGSSDDKILAQLIQGMNTIDDMLTSGLDTKKLPTIDSKPINTDNLSIPTTLNTVELVFTQPQYDQLTQYIDSHQNTDMIGLIPEELYEQFSTAITEYADRNNVKNLTTIITLLIQQARIDGENALTDKETGNE